MKQTGSHGRLEKLNVAARPRHALWCAFALVVWLSASGAGCPQVVQQYTQPMPRALPPTASLQQVINVVNDNSARVQTVSTTRASLLVPGAPSLNANIAFSRPRSFRLVAQKFIGPEVDMGSNDEQLWFWVKHSPSPAMFYCRHADFGASAARQVIPVEPEWLIAAMGVVTIDPNDEIRGPTPVGKNRLEIQTRSKTSTDGISKITIIDDTRGVVLEEHVYDAQRNRLASAVLSKHVRDPVSGVTLPRHVEIQMPPSNLNLTIDMSDVQINQLTTTTPDLFNRPSYSGYPEVDLAHPNGQLTPNANGPSGAPAQARYQ